VTLDANKALVRRLFEEVFPAGDPSAVHELVAPEIIDHNPMPGQPPGVKGIEYVVSRLHTAHPDLRFTVDDLVAEADRVAIRWTLRATGTGSMLGQSPGGTPVEQTAIVIFRIADGKIAERWAGFSPMPATPD
jgi:predicted ester cyclase